VDGEADCENSPSPEGGLDGVVRPDMVLLLSLLMLLLDVPRRDIPRSSCPSFPRDRVDSDQTSVYT